MPVTFPAIRPGSRRLIPGTVPQSVTRAINGRTVRRPFASHQGGMRLEVEFPNRPDSEVDAIRQARDAAGDDPVLLPDELFAGDPELLVFVKFLPPDTAWRFSGDVEVEWAKRGRATIRVQFANYRRTVFTLPPPPEIEPPPVTGVTSCLYLSEATPVFTQQTDTYSMFSPDGERVYTATVIQGVVATDRRFALLAHDKQGNLLWAAEDTRAREVQAQICGIAVLPDGSVVMVAREGGSSRVLLYKFSPTGALLVQTAFDRSGTAGQGTFVYGAYYIASIDKIATDWAGPGICLYDPVTLQPTSSIFCTVSGGALHRTLLYTENNNRFITMGVSSNNIVLYEHDAADVSVNTQKYIYGTSTIPVPGGTWKRYGVDQFGAVYCLGIDTGGTAANRGVYILKLSASAGGFIPLQAVQIGVTGDPIGIPSEVYSRIQIKPDGDILVLWVGGTNETRYVQVWAVAADLTVAKSRIVCTSTRAGGAETHPITGGEFTFSADYKRLVVSAPRVSPLIIPLDLPVNNEITFASASHGTVRVYAETMNRAATNRADMLPARSANANSLAPSTATPVSLPPTMADLTARYTWNALGQCKTFTEVAGFAVSETTTVTANMAIGGNNWYYQTALTTAAGNIYFAGLATTAGQTYSQARWYLMKYDKDLNQLWANWLEGPYPSGTLPANSQDNGPALAEGPGDGVFLVTKGISKTSPTTGASFRIYLFNATGALLNTAAWQVGYTLNAFNNPQLLIQEDMPQAALYVPSQDRLYIAGQAHLRVTMRGLTLDQPYVVDGGGTSQGGPKRVFWLPDKQRVLYVGRAEDGITTGWYVAEYSPDLQTRYQSYSYNFSAQYGNAAVDAFGAVYIAFIDIYNRKTQITKLAASDGGYVPIWSKTFTVAPGHNGFIQVTGCAIEIMPDGRIVLAVAGAENSGSTREMRAHFHVIAPDGTKATARTSLLWTGLYAATNYSSFVDYVREVATFIAGPFTIGKTSLKLPPIGVDLPLGSTAAGGNANKNMTGATDYTEVLLTDAALPSRTVISTPTRNGNPMVKWAEPAWSTSDLTATVSHVTKSTGPLQVP